MYYINKHVYKYSKRNRISTNASSGTLAPLWNAVLSIYFSVWFREERRSRRVSWCTLRGGLARL